MSNKTSIIDTFYPSVSSLKDFMDELVEEGECQRDDDSMEFKRFLQNTLVGHGPIPNKQTKSEPIEPLSDTVLRVVKIILQRNSNHGKSNGGGGEIRGRPAFASNVLTMGFLRQGHIGGSTDNGLTNRYVNSSVVELSQPRWIQLWQRTGTDAMRYLLLYTSIFLRLHSGSYHQITGIQLIDLRQPCPPSIQVDDIDALFESVKKRKNQQGEDDNNRICKKSRQQGKEVQLIYENVNRRVMLYSSPRLRNNKVIWKLPAAFPLNNIASPAELAGRIFAHTPKFAANPPEQLLTLITRMIRLHGKCNYQFHLFKQCPVDWKNTRQKISGDSKSRRYLDAAIGHDQVNRFLQKCIEMVIPHDLLGGKRNKRSVYNLLRQMVYGGQYEALIMTPFAERVNVKEIELWLGGNVGDSGIRIYMGLVRWLFAEYIVSLVRACFYVTESSSGHNELYYFRGDVWASISKTVWKTLEATMYDRQTLSRIAVNGNNKQEPTFGYSKTRLLPKDKGVRPIVNMRKSYYVSKRSAAFPKVPNIKTGYVEKPLQMSTNRTLANSLAVMSSIRKTQPELFGTSVSGISEVYKRLQSFKSQPAIREYLASVSSIDSSNKLYMAKMDLSQAYDTILQPKLLELLDANLPFCEYMVHNYWTLAPSFSRYRTSFLRHGGPANEAVPFGELAHTLSNGTRHIVYGDKSTTIYVDAAHIRGLIHEHMTNNMIRASSGIYRQRTGIPQGSAVSTILCNFYYGQLEREYLCNCVDSTCTLMMRMTDDFLIISTQQQQVETVLKQLYHGIPEYGCQLNKAKTLVNFDVTVAGNHIAQTDSPEFPWTGLVINDLLLDVMADYGKLAGAANIDMTLTFESGRAGMDDILQRKMFTAVRNKLHGLFIGTNFNSKPTVQLNLYQNFLVCGKKLHGIYKQLPMSRRSLAQTEVGRAIQDTISLAYMLLSSKRGSSAGKLCSFTPAEVTCLGLLGFQMALGRKQSRYKPTLAWIGRILSLPKFKSLAKGYEVPVIQSPTNRAALEIKY